MNSLSFHYENNTHKYYETTHDCESVIHDVNLLCIDRHNSMCNTDSIDEIYCKNGVKFVEKSLEICLT